MKKLIWLPAIGEMILVPQVTTLKSVFNFFPNIWWVMGYIIYQSTMWALIISAFVLLIIK